MTIKLNKNLAEDTINLQVTDTNLVTIECIVDRDDNIATVQLASDDELEKLIAEFEDPDGDLMWQDGSICGKYKELNKFRP